MNGLTSLLRAFGIVHAPAAKPHAAIAALRASLEEARQSLQRWKSRSAQLGALIHDVERRASTEQAAARQAAAVAQTWRHEMLSPVAVRSRFGHRLRTFEARQRHVPAAEREARLIAASEAYRVRLAAGVRCR